MPRISIIIPAYNAEAYLRQCLESIFTQDYTDYEVLCIDDGSTDGTAALLGEYAAKYTNLQVLTQSNSGMATARNSGLDAAQGEYILFVDSDDWLCENALSTLAQALNGEDIIEFGSYIYNEETQTITHFQLSTFNFQLCSGWDYFNHERLSPRPVHFVCIWQRAYRRAFLIENNLRFADGLRRAEDDLYTTQTMLQARSVKIIDACIYTYRVRANSITRTTDPRLDADSWRVQQLLADTFIPMQGIDKTAIYQVLASNFINHLTVEGNYLSSTEWHQFHEVCVISRHRWLYHIANISPSLLRLYNRICSSFH